MNKNRIVKGFAKYTTLITLCVFLFLMVFPLIRPEIFVVVLTTTIFALKAFGQIFAMTRGGPGSATMVASYFSYKNFFEKMARDRPDVLFVCSAGNDGEVVDGTERYPSGLNLPNMITVGNVMNDGTRAAGQRDENTLWSWRAVLDSKLQKFHSILLKALTSDSCLFSAKRKE